MKKRLVFVVLLAMILCACGTQKDKASEKISKTNVIETENKTEKEVQKEEGAEALEVETKNTELLIETPETKQTTKETTKKPSSQTQTTKKSSVQTQTTQKTNEQEQTTQKPSTQTQTTQKPTEPKKQVDAYGEEIIGEEVLFKYGITQHLYTWNTIGVYDDGSEEIIATHSYIEYNQETYHATNDELQSETESTMAKHMSYYQEILRLVNEIRAEAGVQPLTLDTTLCKAATMRAVEMNYRGKCSHTRPDGSSWTSAIDYYGVDHIRAGENIAAGQQTLEEVVGDWKASQGHYENMVNPQFTKLGVGYSNVKLHRYKNHQYWCQLFTN